jgi:hypothetical protein
MKMQAKEKHDSPRKQEEKQVTKSVKKVIRRGL